MTKAKDPAFLFYYRDFLVGTSFMTLEETGAYIKLLCFLASRGDNASISKEDILKKIPPHIWDSICNKFTIENGLYFNDRLRKEMIKRRKWTDSRRKNLDKGTDKTPHMEPHMANANANANANKKEEIVKRRFEDIWTKYPRRINRKKAESHFRATVKNDMDWDNIQKALNNYLKSSRIKNRVDDTYVQHGSTWFNNWHDWVDYTEKDTKKGGMDDVIQNDDCAKA